MRKKESDRTKASLLELGTLFNKSHQIDPFADIVSAIWRKFAQVAAQLLNPTYQSIAAVGDSG